MGKQFLDLNIPVLIKSNENKVFCPLFNVFFLLEDEPKNTTEDENLKIEVFNPSTKENSTEVNNMNLNYIKNLSKVVDKLYELTVLEYKKKHYIPEPPPLTKYNFITLSEGEFWLTYAIRIEIHKGKFENILPIIYLGSAVIYQGLTLCTAAISIYVKGLSIPVTLTLSMSSALLSIINFTQADTTSNIARIGRYLDHVSLKRSLHDIVSLKNKKQLFSSGIVFSGILIGAIAGDSASTLSQIEIIDEAGRERGLSFLSDNLIFLHGFLAALCGAIAYGTFGGNYAMKAAIKVADWMFVKMNPSEVSNARQTKIEEISPLISSP